MSDPHELREVLSSGIIHVSTNGAGALIKMPAAIRVVELSCAQSSQWGG